MRRLLRIYEPVIESTIGRIAGQHQSSYICRRCRRRNAASQLSTPTSQFSTSVQRTSEIKDVLGRYAGAFKGETSVFDNQDTQKKEEPYTPATTWEGLEWVGTKQWYEDRKRPQKAFTAYGPITVPLQDRMEIRDELLKAIIEVFTIRKAFPETWREISSQAALDHSDDFPKGIRVGCDQNTNQPIFEFESENVEKRFLEHLRRLYNPGPEPNAVEASEAGREPDGFEHNAVEPLQAKPIEESDSQAQAHQGPAETEPSVATFSFADLLDQTCGKWSSIDLKDLDIKFAIAKRVQQRTGIRLTDPQITHSKTAGALFVHLWKPEKPKKLAEHLLDDEGLANLPNVKISDHRITLVHREREVGRWKVIEEELNERGIPPLTKTDKSRRGTKLSIS